MKKILKININITFENTFPTFNQAYQAQSFSNTPNTRYLQQNNNIIYHNNNPKAISNLNFRDIKEIK